MGDPPPPRHPERGLFAFELCLGGWLMRRRQGSTCRHCCLLACGAQSIPTPAAALPNASPAAACARGAGAGVWAGGGDGRAAGAAPRTQAVGRADRPDNTASPVREARPAAPGHARAGLRVLTGPCPAIRCALSMRGRAGARRAGRGAGWSSGAVGSGRLHRNRADRRLFHGDWLDSGDRAYAVAGEFFITRPRQGHHHPRRAQSIP